jgi:hypothetical protein
MLVRDLMLDTNPDRSLFRQSAIPRAINIALLTNSALAGENLGRFAEYRRLSLVGLALLGIVVLSLSLNLAGHDFPLGYHFDEQGKVDQIVAGRNLFSHPAFMIEANRLVHFFTQDETPQQIVETGRALTALFGAAIVAASFLLFRPLGGSAAALLTCLAVAVSPILVVHAHYLKEDSYFTFAVTLALAAYLAFLHRMDARRTVLLGVATGLALATKYAGALLFLFYAIELLWIDAADRRHYVRGIAGALAIALAVFLIVDFRLFGDTAVFFHNLGFEIGHAATGHANNEVKMAITALDYWFAFHLLYSILPGIGIVMAGAVVLALAQWALGLLPLSHEEKILAGFALFFYLAIEISPSKPFPDFMRYAMPIVPVLLYLAVRGLLALGRRIAPSYALLGPLLCLAAIAAPGYDSVRLVANLNDDTRAALVSALQGLHGTVLEERYAAPDSIEAISPSGTWPVLAEEYAVPESKLFTASLYPIATLRTAGIRYVAVSSFTYDRYEVSGRLAGQDPEIYRRRQRYEDLFACGYRAFRPAYRSFGFSNPEIRLIDLAGCKD